MKFLVHLNTNIDISSNLNEAKLFFAKHNIDIDFSSIQTNIPVSIKSYKTVQGFNPITGKKGEIKYYGISNALSLENSYDGNIFVWDLDTVKQPTDGVITSWTTNYIQVAINKYLKEKGGITNRITHEIIHYLCVLANKKGFKTTDEMDITSDGKAFYKNDEPDAPNGNYARTFKNLQHFINSLQKPMYKYFSEKEIVGLKPKLVEMLDKARGIAGIPFKITSGYRTTEHNAQVGGVSDSSHTTGLAVDLLVKDGVSGGKILLALVQAGFTRFGFYKDGHIHVDIDNTKPNPCYWVK